MLGKGRPHQHNVFWGLGALPSLPSNYVPHQQKMSSVSGGHLIQRNFSLTKGTVLWAAKCPLCFFHYTWWIPTGWPWYPREIIFFFYKFADALPRAAIYFASDLPIDHYLTFSFTPLNFGLAFPWHSSSMWGKEVIWKPHNFHHFPLGGSHKWKSQLIGKQFAIKC